MELQNYEDNKSMIWISPGETKYSYNATKTLPVISATDNQILKKNPTN